MPGPPDGSPGECRGLSRWIPRRMPGLLPMDPPANAGGPSRSTIDSPGESRGFSFWVQCASGRRGGGRGEDLQQLAPAALGVEPGPHRIGLLGVALEVAMLELDAGAVRADRDETHLDLGPEARVVLPVGSDLPRQDEAVGRLPDQHVTPVALAAVDAALEPAAARPRLHDRGLCRGLADVVGGERPPGDVPLRDYGEC